MARRRRRRPYRRVVAFSLAAVLIAGYLMFGPPLITNDSTLQSKQKSAAGIPLASVSQPSPNAHANPTTTTPSAEETRPNSELNSRGSGQSDFRAGLNLLKMAEDAMSKENFLTARSHFNDALKRGLPAPHVDKARKVLCQLADRLVFAPRRIDEDPLTSMYVVQSGDTLEKISKQYHITPDLIADINDLKDKNVIRVGQNLKVVHGPFNAVIHKSSYDLFVYLQDQLVIHYRVGLGEEGSTPSGSWKIKNKLVNPTYYPPRGGRIIAADDPENPLGERWLGLEGVSGEAIGQLRYGIHGTNDPKSIGQNMSLGCVRLNNSDVENLYKLLVVEHSTITIQD